jgi:undecaprenyl-diphosphatase
MQDPLGWKVIILGIVQGVSEFLPISSDGHLLLAEHAFGISQNQLSLVIWLHLGTLAATCLVYWRELRDILRGDWWTALLLVMAMLPAAAFGLTCKSMLEEKFYHIEALGYFFWVTALALFLGERIFRTNGIERETISVTDALVIGIAQALAILPGVSRSGMTIAAGLACGLRRPAAARFSFLLSIPAVGGAVLLEGYETVLQDNSSLDPWPIAVGVITSFVAGLIALRWLLWLLRRYPMHGFAIYCTLLGAAVFVWGVVLPRIQ